MTRLRISAKTPRESSRYRFGVVGEPIDAA